uniref:Uncharacterized protein n=1 Tax=Anguilla anguilla TaxID=7936 RepID=A0A0E9TXI8_ANGAN
MPAAPSESRFLFPPLTSPSSLSSLAPEVSISHLLFGM